MQFVEAGFAMPTVSAVAAAGVVAVGWEIAVPHATLVAATRAINAPEMARDVSMRNLMLCLRHQ